jgi:tetratricopeptide (TPR) repeat protein
VRFHEAALEIAEELGDLGARTLALDRLSCMASNLLDLERAIELGERGLRLASNSGDEELVGRAMDGLKLAALQLGDLHRLDEITRELERIWRSRNDLFYLQFTLLESAFVPIGAGEWLRAEDRLAEALEINRRMLGSTAEPLFLDAMCWLDRSRGEGKRRQRRARSLRGSARMGQMADRCAR